jgi:trimethylamine---corrinoid protein Co-methyltransferase
MIKDGLLPSAEAAQRIHQAALQVLNEFGMCVDHAGLRARLADAGCQLDGERVHMPPGLVGRALAQIPPSCVLYGRSARDPVRIGPDSTLFTNTGIFASICDLETGQVRPSTLADVAATTRLLDALENVDLVYVSLVDATDVAPHLVTVSDFAATLENTTKAFIGPGLANRAEAETVVAMARAVRGGEQALRDAPLCVPFVCPISPLRLPHDVAEALIVVCEAGLPLDALSNPVMGASAPYTVAGTVVLGHAEVLAVAVIAQLLAPGLPILLQNTPSVADMRTMGSTTGGPETGLLRQTAMLVSRSLNIPCCAHGHTSSARLDFQAAEEKALNSLLIAAALPAVLGGIGALANVTLTSYEALVLDNERHGAIRRILQGVQVDDDHLALDVIAGLVHGEAAIASPHTLRYLRSPEVWRPRLAVRVAQGGAWPAETSVDRARAEVKHLLASHSVEPLPDTVRAEIAELLRAHASQQR